MLISDQKRFLFIHLIKTAGTSITEALKPYAKTHKEIGQGYTCHDSAQTVIAKMGRETFDSYFSFAVVRNPWDLQVSVYHYVLKTPKHARHAEFVAFGSFSEFLKWRCSDEVVNQRDLLFSGEEQLVDFIGKYENLEADFRTICERIGVTVELPVLNQSTTEGYKSYYTPEMVEMVGRSFERDIRQFGYQFE